MNDLNQLVVWSTLLASVASLFTALITYVMVLEMRKQRLSQSAPKLVVAGELFYDVKVVRGKSGVPSPLYPTHHTVEKLQLHNVGSGDALSIVANFKFIELCKSLNALDSSFNFTISGGFVTIDSLGLKASFSIAHLENVPIELIREDQSARLEIPSFLEAIMMAIGEVYSLPFHQGVMPLLEPSKFILKYEIRYADAMNQKHKDLHEIKIEPIMLITIADGFNLHLRVLG